MQEGRTRSAEDDERIGQLMRVVARLEHKSNEIEGKVDEVESRVKNVETTIQNFAHVADDLAVIRGVRSLLSKWGWGLLVAAVSFVLSVYALRDKIAGMSEDQVEVKGRQAIHENILRQIEVNVRSMEARLSEWSKAEERRAQDAERRIDRLEERKRKGGE